MLLACCCATACALGQSPSDSSKPSSSPSSGATQSNETKAKPHGDVAPRSDDAQRESDAVQMGESSSSNETKINLDAPADDDRAHPDSANSVAEAEAAAHGGESVGEFHPWDPHKAAKDVEVGDFYFKRGNYRGAESRYREALFYKDNDAIATLRLAECLEKLGQNEEAAERYQGYLKIMPHGPQSEEARQGLARVQQPPKSTAVSSQAK